MFHCPMVPSSNNPDAHLEQRREEAPGRDQYGYNVWDAERALVYNSISE